MNSKAQETTYKTFNQNTKNQWHAVGMFNWPEIKGNFNPKILI